MKSPAITIPIVAGIGNAIMTEPMVRQLRDARRDARVRVVAMTAAMGEVFRRVPGVEVTVCGRGALNLFRALRESPIDTLIVPFPSNRWQYNALAWRSGARQVVMHGYPPGRRAWLSSLIGQRVQAVRGIHDVVQNLRLLEAVGVRPRFDDPPRFELTRDDVESAGATLRAAQVEGAFIAVHAGSARTILSAAKRWPAAKYGELIGRLARECNQRVVVLEGPDEAGVAGEIIARLRGAARPVTALRLTGSLGVAGGVLARASVYVGSDSGLAHLAAAVGRPAVTLFAPADPSRVCPFGNDDLVVKAPTACSPCFLYPWEAAKPRLRCRPPFCVERIEVEMVMSKVRAALGSGDHAGASGTPVGGARHDS